MKTKSTQDFYRTLFYSACLLLTFTAFTACSVVESAPATERDKTSRKERAVKIRPDIVKRVMHVKNTENEKLDFFVFDGGGAIVLHYKMAEKEHKTISGLDRGTYVYQVFAGDAMTESGKLTIK